MSDITETMTVKNGQAAVKTVTVAGKLSPKTSATDTIALVETSDGKQAALKVYNINGEGGGGGDYDAEIEALENAVSVLTTSVELSTEIGQMTTVLLDELLTLDVDGRPDYKAPGATVYAENGVTGIIDTIDNSAQTAVVKTVSVSTGGGAGGDYLPLSGGTLTGTLKSNVPYFTNSLELPGFSITRQSATRAVMSLGMSTLVGDVNTLRPYSDNGTSFGSSEYKWANVFTTKLNNGADLLLPTEGGTLARLEDLDNILEIEEF